MRKRSWRHNIQQERKACRALMLHDGDRSDHSSRLTIACDDTSGYTADMLETHNRQNLESFRRCREFAVSINSIVFINFQTLSHEDDEQGRCYRK